MTSLFGTLLAVAVVVVAVSLLRPPRTKSPPTPLNPEAVARLMRIQTARRAHHLKAHVDRNIQHARREAIRQMRDI
jgi:hypothetical protein